MNYLNLFYQLLPEAVLVITALTVLGIAIATESKSGKPMCGTRALSIAAIGVVIALLALYFGPKDVDSGVAVLTLDPMALVFKGIVLGLGLLAILLPTARKEIQHIGEYYALMLFALTGLLLTVGTNNLMFLFVTIELASLSLYLLAGFSRTQKASEASLKYFMFGGVSAAFMLFGLSFLYGFSHSATLEGVAAALSVDPTNVLGIAGLLMVLVGLGFKMAAAPFHYWAPDVYQGAPSTTASLISASSKVVGMVVLVRILMIGFQASAGSAGWGDMAAGWSVWLAVLAAVSIITGNILALAQKSVRRMLAYSAVSNTGYLLVGLSAHGAASSAAALFYVVVYGLATMGALAVTAAVERDKGSDSRESFAGLVHRAPLQAVALFIFMASLAGIPPLAGFAGKFILFGAALKDTMTDTSGGLAWLVGLAVVMSAVSLYYYLSVLKQAFVKGDPEDAAVNTVSEDGQTNIFHMLAIAIPAVALVLLGLFPGALLETITTAVKTSLGM